MHKVAHSLLSTEVRDSSSILSALCAVRSPPFSENMYQLPVAAVTNHYKLSDIKQHKFMILQFWMPEVQNQGVDRVGFFWGLGENLYCALPPPCGGCQQLLACSHITPVSASVFTLPSPCHTCLSSFDVFLRPGVIGFRVGPNPQ